MGKYADHLKYNPLDNRRKAAELIHLLKLEVQDIRETADYNLATSRPSEYDEHDHNHDHARADDLWLLVDHLTDYAGEDEIEAARAAFAQGRGDHENTPG